VVGRQTAEMLEIQLRRLFALCFVLLGVAVVCLRFPSLIGVWTISGPFCHPSVEESFSSMLLSLSSDRAFGDVVTDEDGDGDDDDDDVATAAAAAAAAESRTSEEWRRRVAAEREVEERADAEERTT